MHDKDNYDTSLMKEMDQISSHEKAYYSDARLMQLHNLISPPTLFIKCATWLFLPIRGCYARSWPLELTCEIRSSVRSLHFSAHFSSQPYSGKCALGGNIRCPPRSHHSMTANGSRVTCLS